MNKNLLALAVAGVFAASGSAFANDHHGKDHGPGAKVNGHIFSTFTVSNDAADPIGPGTNPEEKKFHTDAEINFKAMVADGVYVRVDLDYGLPGGDGIEQAYGAWKAHDMVKLQIGRFNSPLGIEAHDQADLTHFISHGYVRHALNDATFFTGGTDGNNIEGVAAHLMAGPAKITIGLLNDIGGVDEENSMLLNISASPIEGLDLALGVITQDTDTPFLGPDDEILGVGNLINFNVAYSLMAADMPVKVWLDFLTAAEAIDSVISVGGSVGFGNGFGAALRYDMAEFDGGGELTAITLAGSYQVADNFDLRLEWRNDDNDVEDFDSIALAAAFKF